MRIIHIDETFHPSFGYQAAPLAKFNAQAGHEVFIIAPEARYMYPVYKDFGVDESTIPEEDELYSKQTGVKIIRVHAHGYVANRLNYCKNELYSKIDEIRPDVLFVHCVETLTAIRVMRKYKNTYPMVFDSHMLSMASTSHFSKVYEIAYRVFVTSLIKKNKYTVIRTQDDDYVTRHLGIPQKQAPFISFGTDVLLFTPNEKAKEEFLKKNNFPEDAFVIVSTGKVAAAKGGKLLAEALKKRFDSSRSVVGVIVANFDGEYEKKVKEILEKSENTILFYPVQKYINLPWFYQIADVTVFPRQCSMSFYDAQSCGSPVILETGHVNETRVAHDNGRCFKSGSLEDFRNQIVKMMEMDTTAYQNMRDNARTFIENDYSYVDISDRYLTECKKAITSFQNKR